MIRATTIIGVAAAVALGACASDGESASSVEAGPGTEPAATGAPTTTVESVPDTTASGTGAADDTSDDSTDDSTDDGEPADHDGQDTVVDPMALLPAYLGAAPYQDVAVAESAGWVSTLDTLGCFEQPGTGGMGVHWLNESLLDDHVDAAQPEALVYELRADGEVAGLVGHEYLVPLDAWTAETPPSLFGLDFHQHPVLPFWILHAYLWKDNPTGMFEDWNPAIRMCPDGVPVFGEEPSE